MLSLHVRDEAGQRPAVVGLGETFPRHQSAPLQLRVGQQEAVRGDALDARVLGPAGEEGLQEAGGGRLADRHAAGDAYDEGRARLRPLLAEEGVQRPAQLPGGAHVEVEQARERQVDVADLVQVDDVAETAQPFDLLGGQRQRGVLAQGAPLRAGQVHKGGGVGAASMLRLLCGRRHGPILRGGAAAITSGCGVRVFLWGLGGDGE
ncbi:hypothetical protein GCM10020000_45660 [Streptomyces olivoverticillatus]